MANLSQKLKDVNCQLVQTIADQQMTEDRLNLQLTRLKLMYDFVSALNTAQTISEIYQIALSGIGAALRTSRLGILIADSTYSLKYQESTGLSENYKRSIEAFFDASCSGTKSTSRTFPHCAILPSNMILQNICHAESIVHGLYFHWNMKVDI